MGFANVFDILSRYRNTSASAPPPSVETDYSHLAPTFPQQDLAGGLNKAFRSNETPPFSQMLSTLFSNSDGSQRAGILNHLLSSVPASVLGSGVFAGLSGLLRGGQPAITPEQANQVSPQAVQQLAEHAERHDPSIVDRASEYYAQHPTLIKALGAGSLALIMSHLSQK
jgi:hypothetical protein